MKAREMDHTDISLARTCLIRARVFKQLEQHHREMQVYYGKTLDISNTILINGLRTKAEQCRYQAQDILKRWEEQNGRRMMLGMDTRPLKLWLSGTEFLLWSEYHHVYEDSPLKEDVW